MPIDESFFDQFDTSATLDTDYSVSTPANQLLANPQFKNDLRQYYETKGESFDNDEDMLKNWYEDSVWAENNTMAGIFGDHGYLAAKNASPEERLRLQRLQRVFDRVPTTGDGGTTDTFGWGKVIGQNVMTAAVDPINLVGGVAGARAAKATFGVASKVLPTGKAVLHGAKAGATSEAVANAVAEGSLDSLQQMRDKETGAQSKYSLSQALFSGALGAGTGAGLGAVFGAAGAALRQLGRSNIDKETAAALDGIGLTFEDFQSLTDEQWQQAILHPYRFGREFIEAKHGRTQLTSNQLIDNAGDPNTPQVSTPESNAANQAIDSMGDPNANPDADLVQDVIDVPMEAEARLSEIEESLNDYSGPLSQTETEIVASLIAERNIINAIKAGEKDALDHWDAIEDGADPTTIGDGKYNQAPEPEQTQSPQTDSEAEQVLEPTSTVDGEVADTTPSNDAIFDDPEITQNYGRVGAQYLIAQGYTPEKIKGAKQVKRLQRKAIESMDFTVAKNATQEDMAVVLNSPQEFLDSARANWPNVREAIVEMREDGYSQLSDTQWKTQERVLHRNVLESIVKTNELDNVSDNVLDVSAKVLRQEKMGKGAKIVLTKEQMLDSLTKVLDADQKRQPKLSETQSILKPSKILGASDPNSAGHAVTRDIETPRKSLMGLEAARAQAELHGTLTPVPYKTTGRQETSGSIKFVKKGTKVWYDPMTKRSYAKFDEMIKARGESPKTEAHDVSTKEMEDQILKRREQQLAEVNKRRADSDDPLPPLSWEQYFGEPKHKPNKVAEASTEPKDALEAQYGFTKEQLKDAMNEFMAGNKNAIDNLFVDSQEDVMRKTTQEHRKAVDAALPDAPKPTKPLNVGDSQQPASGYTPAIMAVKGPHVGTAKAVRILTPKQMNEGLTLADILGRQNPNDWVMGVVPNGTRAGRSAASKFIVDQDGVTLNDLGETIKKTEAEALSDAPEVTQIGKHNPNEVAFSVNNLTQRQADALHLAAEVSNAKFGDNEKVSHDALDALINNLESINWGKLTQLKLPNGSKNGVLIARSVLSELYGIQDQYSAGGVIKNVGTREEAMMKLDTIFSGSSPEEIAIAKDFINRVSTNLKLTPLLDIETSSDFGSFYAGDNIVRMAEGDTAFSKVHTLMHEVAHWAYFNVLTPKDKAEYWKYVEKNLSNRGKPIQSEIEASNPTHAGQYDYLSDALAPQESFANDFMRYAHDVLNGKHDMDNLPAFKRAVKYMKAIIDSFLGRKVPKDLEKIFAKILPRDEAVEEALAGSGKIFIDGVERNTDRIFNIHEAPPPLKKMGKAILSRWIELDDIESQIIRSIDEDTMSPEPASALAEFMYSIATKQGQLRGIKDNSQYRGKTGALRPILDIANIITDTAREINHYVGRSYGTDEIETGTIRHFEDHHFAAWIDLYNNGNETIPPVKETIAAIKFRMGQTYHKSEGIRLVDGIETPFKLDYGNPIDPDEWKTIRAKLEASGAARELAATNAAKHAVANPSDALKNSSINKLDSIVKKQVDKAKARSNRTASFDELMDDMEKAKGTDVELSAAKEFIRIINAEPFQAEPVAVRSDVINGKVDELTEKLQDALTRSDSDLVSEITYELQRRAYNKQNKANKIKPFFRPKDSRIQDAIASEVRATVGLEIEPDIPTNLPSWTQDALRAITHRDPEAQSAARVMTLRLLNLMNKGVLKEMGNVQFLSTEDVYKLAGKPYQSGSASSTFADFTGNEFNELRKRVRRMAIGITRGKASPIDVMHEIGHATLRTGLFDETELNDILTFYRAANDPRKATIQSKYKDYGELEQAEEWFTEGFAQYAAERVTRNDIQGIRLEGKVESINLRSRIGEFLDRLIEGVAYITNGLIGRKSVKQMYRRMTFYGDMFNRKSKIPEPKSIQTIPESARDAAAIKLDNMSVQTRKQIKGYVKGGISDRDGLVKVFYARQTNGRVTLHEVPEIADYDARIGELMKSIARTRTELAYIKGEIEMESVTADLALLRKHSEGSNPITDGVAMKTGQLKRLMATLDMVNQQYARAGKASSVIPVVTKARSMLNMTSDDTFKPEVLTQLFKGVANTLSNRFNVSKDDIATAMVEIRELGGLKADEAFDKVKASLRRAASNSGSTLSSDQLSDIINKSARDVGYEGIAVNHGFEIFDPEKVLELDEGNFPTMPEYPDNPEAKRMMNTMAATIMQTGIPMDSRFTGATRAVMDAKGIAPKLNATLHTLAKRRTLKPEEVEAISEYSPLNFLRSNSDVMRQKGFGWLADWIKPESGIGHYERTQAYFADRVLPIMKNLNALPDGGGAIKRWAIQGIMGRQPDSHKKIVKALRRPSGSAQEQALSQQEKVIYDQIRSSFLREVTELRSAGVVVGKIENYFPQIWNTDAINKNPETFRARVADYLQHEALAQGRDNMTRERALEVADDVMTKLTSEGGVYISAGGKGETIAEHADFARMFRYDRYPELLDGIEEFMEDNLLSQIVKYYEQSSTRIDFTKQYGVGNHALRDYFDTVDGGWTAAAKLLSQDRELSVKRKQVDSKTGDVEKVKVHQGSFRSPFRSEAAAMEWLMRHRAEIELGNADEVAAQLKEFLPDDDFWIKRSRAIVEALHAFRGQKQPVSADDRRHVHGTMQVVMNKPVNPEAPAFDWKNNTSKFLRNVNSVTLLSYTTLTSLTDLVMPLVRSGSMKSWVGGIAKYMAEPEYRDSIKNIGTAIESLVHQRLTNLHGTDATKFTSGFFNFTGLTPWTDFNKNLAASVGVEALQAEQKRYFKYRNAADDTSKGKARMSERRLTKYGLQEYLKDDAVEIKNALDAKDVKQAIIKFTNETIFSPNNNDIPLWAQTPFGRLVFQLKSFPLMLGRLAHETLLGEGAVQGKKAGAMYFATIAPLFAAGALATKDVLQARGGEDNQSMAVRERSLSKIAESFGYDVNIHGKTMGISHDEFAGWAIEGFIHLGGLGLLADVLYNSAAQLDNGAYGYNRVASTILGPAYGLGSDAFTVMSGLMDGSDNSNAKERAAVRSLIGRTPLLGGNSWVKESLTDEMMGEPSDGKSATWSN